MAALGTVPSLQRLVFSEACISYFRSSDPPETFPQYRGLYSFAMPERELRERVEQIKNRFMDELRSYFWQAVEGDEPTLAKLEEILEPSDGIFAQGMIRDFYEQGTRILPGYLSVNLSLLASYSREQALAREPRYIAFASKWYKRIQKDFEEGAPQSFPAMSDFVKEKDSFCGPTPSHQIPFDQSRATLRKLAYLGVRNASNILTNSLHEQYRSDKSGELISFYSSNRERIEELKWCAELGDPWSQHQLARVYYDREMYADVSLSLEERKAGLKRMVEIEVGHNFFVTLSYREDPFDAYSLEHRIDRLTDRAKKGDGHSLIALLGLYGSNKLGENQFPLDLTREQRWEKLNALKSAANRESFRDMYVYWLADPDQFPSLHFEGTARDRLAELEKVVFGGDDWGSKYSRDSYGERVLIDCYSNNGWKNTSLQIPIKERVEKLERCARLGNSDAMFVLHDYYLSKDSGRPCPDGIPCHLIGTVPGAKITDQPNPPPLVERTRHLKQIAKEGNHGDYLLKYSQTFGLSDVQRRVSRMALVHLKVLKHCQSVGVFN